MESTSPEIEQPVAEPVAEPAEPVEPVEPVDAAPPEAKRQRGRPPGSKNKPKIRVVPLEVPAAEPPPAEPDEAKEPETPAPKKRARIAETPRVMVMPQLAPATPHETFRMAMEALSRVAQADRASKQSHYDALVARMVR